MAEGQQGQPEQQPPQAQPPREQRSWLSVIRRAWLPVVVIVIALAAGGVILLIANVGRESPVWFLALLAITIAVLLAVIFVLIPFEKVSEDREDPVPIRIGVILLGVIVVACIAGLIQVVNNPPQVVEGQVIETTTPPTEDTTPSKGGETSGGGETTTTPGVETTTVPSTGTVANTANLGLSGQIVGIFGTIAAAAVGGIAGLLTSRR